MSLEPRREEPQSKEDEDAGRNQQSPLVLCEDRESSGGSEAAEGFVRVHDMLKIRRKLDGTSSSPCREPAPHEDEKKGRFWSILIAIAVAIRQEKALKVTETAEDQDRKSGRLTINY